MISIIVPIYKVEPYLRDCLDSIMKQSYDDYEVILVDDGSPDGCGEICDEYVAINDKWKVIHQVNGGLSVARNAGLSIAKGEYICFIDSDDSVDSNYLEMLYSAIVRYEADLAICGYQRIRKKADISSVHNDNFQYMDEKLLWDEVFGNLNNAAWNKLYKRELIAEQRFVQDLYHGEDLIFNLEYISKCHSAVKIDESLYHYWERSGSVTQAVFSERKLMEITAKDVAKKYVSQNYPELIPCAEKYCFRARMNVLRAIFKSQKENEYSNNIKEYKDYIKKNYCLVKKDLRIKEKIEYLLLVKSKWLYCILVRK